MFYLKIQNFQFFPDMFLLTADPALRRPIMRQPHRPITGRPSPLPASTDRRRTPSVSMATTMPRLRISTESRPMPTEETELKIWKTTFPVFRVKIIQFWLKFQNSRLPVKDVSLEVENHFHFNFKWNFKIINT